MKHLERHQHEHSQTFFIAIFTLVMGGLIMLFSSCEKAELNEGDSTSSNSNAHMLTAERSNEPINQTTSSAPAMAYSSTDVKIVLDDITDAFGGLPIFPNTPLYIAQPPSPIFIFPNPLLKPGGQQITFGEFNQVTGLMTLTCVPVGTRLSVRVQNLIPYGAYSIFVKNYKYPGYNGTNINLLGLGAAGIGNGVRSSFKASASGEGVIGVIQPSGSLSVFGNIGQCMLTDAFQVYITGIYHADGNFYGPNLGPQGSYVEQFAFSYTNL